MLVGKGQDAATEGMEWMREPAIGLGLLSGTADAGYLAGGICIVLISIGSWLQSASLVSICRRSRRSLKVGGQWAAATAAVLL